MTETGRGIPVVTTQQHYRRAWYRERRRQYECLMPGRPPLQGKTWTGNEQATLRQRVEAGLDVVSVALAHQRSFGSVCTQISALHLWPAVWKHDPDAEPAWLVPGPRGDQLPNIPEHLVDPQRHAVMWGSSQLEAWGEVQHPVAYVVQALPDPGAPKRTFADFPSAMHAVSVLRDQLVARTQCQGTRHDQDRPAETGCTPECPPACENRFYDEGFTWGRGELVSQAYVSSTVPDTDRMGWLTDRVGRYEPFCRITAYEPVVA